MEVNRLNKNTQNKIFKYFPSVTKMKCLEMKNRIK